MELCPECSRISTRVRTEIRGRFTAYVYVCRHCGEWETAHLTRPRSPYRRIEFKERPSMKCETCGTELRSLFVDVSSRGTPQYQHVQTCPDCRATKTDTYVVIYCASTSNDFDAVIDRALSNGFLPDAATVSATGRKIKRLRTLLGIAQSAVAQEAGVAREAVWRWEAGHSNADNIVAAQHALHWLKQKYAKRRRTRKAGVR